MTVALEALATEEQNRATADIDQLTPLDIVRRIHQEDAPRLSPRPWKPSLKAQRGLPKRSPKGAASFTSAPAPADAWAFLTPANVRQPMAATQSKYKALSPAVPRRYFVPWKPPKTVRN